MLHDFVNSVGKREGEVDRDTECEMYLIVNKISIMQFRAYNVVTRQMPTPKDKLEAKELAWRTVDAFGSFVVVASFLPCYRRFSFEQILLQGYRVPHAYRTAVQNSRISDAVCIE